MCRHHALFEAIIFFLSFYCSVAGVLLFYILWIFEHVCSVQLKPSIDADINWLCSLCSALCFFIFYAMKKHTEQFIGSGDKEKNERNTMTLFVVLIDACGSPTTQIYMRFYCYIIVDLCSFCFGPFDQCTIGNVDSESAGSFSAFDMLLFCRQAATTTNERI